MDGGETQIVTFARHADVALGSLAHCLDLIEGVDFGRVFVIGPQGATLGRTAPADIVLNDSEVSRAHCRVNLLNDILVVTDLGSTNGTFINGVRVTEPTPVPVGAVLRIGRQALKHEWRSEREILQHHELERELRKANTYVQALLPPPLSEGEIRTEWLFEPCSKLGGDAFGYGRLSDNRFLFYMMDVSGHGAGAAMHSVAVMNLLRQRALPGADMSRPEEVLRALNAMFQMEDHAGMYFTMWYGVYDGASRELHFTSAGHHPAFLVPPGRGEAIALRTRSGLVGADPGTIFRSDKVLVPPGGAIYLFSDGVFEIVTKGGVQWGLGDFVPYLTSPGALDRGECQRLYKDVRGLAQSGSLEDDFSLLVLNFD
jgi:serine phosphatase RsbU (regulator of sigma subunit)